MTIKISYILCFLYFLCFLCVLLITITFVYFVRTKYSEHFNTTQLIDKDVIYCVMITGKDKSRWQFANIAISNFNEQSYPDKKLIIINEGQELGSLNSKNILEIKIDKAGKGLTLGDMRNMAFEFIPENAIWTLWDDDDWRSKNYLNTLHTNLKDNDYLFFSKRLEHNLNTGFTWTMELKSGFVIMFGRRNVDCKYDSKDVNEDIVLKDYIKDNLKYKVLVNDPKIYIRMVHNSNTSVLVNKTKHKIKDTSRNKVYYEYDASIKDKQYVKDIVMEKYNMLH